MKKYLLPKLSFHPFFFSGLFLLLFAMPQENAFAILSSVLLHESGHLSAALLFGRRIRGVKLMPMGISIEPEMPASYLEEAIIAMAGPLMNLCYLPCTALFPHILAERVVFISLFLAFLNLLPIEGFDGGRILGALLASLFGDPVRVHILQITTALVLMLLWVIALYIFFYSGVNFMLLLFCAYLFSFLILKNRTGSEK